MHSFICNWRGNKRTNVLSWVKITLQAKYYRTCDTSCLVAVHSRVVQTTDPSPLFKSITGDKLHFTQLHWPCVVTSIKKSQKLGGQRKHFQQVWFTSKKSALNSSMATSWAPFAPISTSNNTVTMLSNSDSWNYRFFLTYWTFRAFSQNTRSEKSPNWSLIFTFTWYFQRISAFCQPS